MKAAIDEREDDADQRGEAHVPAAVRGETVMAEAISRAEQSAKKSPNRCCRCRCRRTTMISTPTIITAMATSVDRPRPLLQE